MSLLKRGAGITGMSTMPTKEADKSGCVHPAGAVKEWGSPARELHPGDVVKIPAGVKHWLGPAKDSWFSHLAIEVPGKNARNEWLEPVSGLLFPASSRTYSSPDPASISKIFLPST